MLRLSALCIVVAVIGLLTINAKAVPLSVRIDEYDFYCDTDVVATYDFNDDGPDELHVGPQGNEVSSYRYMGTAGATDPLGNAPGVYPVWASSTPPIFGGDLELDLQFTASDGPYDAGGDVMEISLTGSSGHLTITGIIGTPMPAGAPMILLDMDFDATSLLGRANSDTIDLIEGRGAVNVLLGEDVRDQGLVGVTFMKFFADAGTIIFPDPPGDQYNPLTACGYPEVVGRVSGEVGIPEPATLIAMAVGGAFVLLRRRR